MIELSDLIHTAKSIDHIVDYSSNHKPVSPLEIQKLLQVCRTTMLHLLSGKQPLEILFKDFSLQFPEDISASFIVRLYSENTIISWGIHNTGSILSRCIEATTHAYRHATGSYSQKLAYKLELSVLFNFVEFSTQEKEDLQSHLTIGPHALFLRIDDHSSFLLPHDAIMNNYSKSQSIEAIWKRIGLYNQFYDVEQYRLFKTDILSSYCSISNPHDTQLWYPTMALLKQKQINRQLCEDSLQSIAHWLCKATNNKGKIVHFIQPCNDKFQYEDSPKIVYQSLHIALSLIQIWHYLKNPLFLKTAQKITNFIYQNYYHQDDNQGHITYDNKPNISATSFALLLLTQWSNNNPLQPKKEMIQTFLMHHFNKEIATIRNGGLTSDNTEHNLYAFILISALISTYSRGTEILDKLISTTIAYKPLVFQNRWINYAVWLSSITRRLFQITSQKELANICFDLCDKTLTRQNQEYSLQAENLGSLHNNLYFHSSLLQTLCEGTTIARLMGETAREKLYTTAIYKALRYLLQHQIHPYNPHPMFYKNSFGAFLENNETFRINTITQNQIALAILKSLTHIKWPYFYDLL